MTISLPEFIADVGDEASAELFGVKLRTIQSWRRRERIPRPDQAQAMVLVAGGRLSLESIYVLPESAAVNDTDVDPDVDPDSDRIAPPVETA